MPRRLSTKEEVEKNIPTGIAHWRTKRGHTPRRLAIGVDVTEQSIRRWESGSTVPGIVDLVRLSEFLECSLTDLVFPPAQ
jgi:transcriptional regulator with XRE-family HTH domain